MGIINVDLCIIENKSLEREREREGERERERYERFHTLTKFPKSQCQVSFKSPAPYACGQERQIMTRNCNLIIPTMQNYNYGRILLFDVSSIRYMNTLCDNSWFHILISIWQRLVMEWCFPIHKTGQKYDFIENAVIQIYSSGEKFQRKNTIIMKQISAPCGHW